MEFPDESVTILRGDDEPRPRLARAGGHDVVHCRRQDTSAGDSSPASSTSASGRRSRPDPAKCSLGVEIARAWRRDVAAGRVVHGDDRRCRSRPARRGPSSSWAGSSGRACVSGGRKGLGAAELDVDQVASASALVHGRLLVGVKIDAAGPQRAHPVDGAVGPAPHEESRPPGRSTRATSGTARASSTQCQADAAMTTS